MLLDGAPHRLTVTVDPAPVEGPDAGVIEEARRRQRRHRVVAAVALVAAVGAGIVAFGVAGGADRGGPPPSVRLSSSLRGLTGAPLRGRTGLALVVAGLGGRGPADIVNVDSGKVRALRGLGVSGSLRMWSPSLQLIPVSGGALAVVTHRACSQCSTNEDDDLITADGSVRRVATRHFPALRGTIETSRIPGTAAEWVLVWPHRGACTLRLLPSTRAPVVVPCGDLGGTFPAGVALWTDHDQRGIIVNPLTGAVRGRLSSSNTYDLVGHGLAIEGASYKAPTSISLVNLATGNRLSLGWPSRLHFGYEVFPEAAGPLVAIDFADPAYPPPPRQTTGQAADLWVLDTRNGHFTHLPGFPSLEAIKLSGIAWTRDGRLIVVAHERHTVLGLWRPGQRTLHLRTVPALNGYSQFVPLTG